MAEDEITTGSADLSGVARTGQAASFTNLTATGNAVLGGAGSTVAFFAVAGTTRPTALTQTYATASRTHAAPTAAAVATTAATNITPFGFAQAQADAIVAAVNALVVDVANVKQVLNAVIDDLQGLGLEQ